MKWKKIKSFMDNNIYDSPYLDTKILESYNAILTGIIGPRGLGKTFHYVKRDLFYCVEHDKKLIYVVETKTDIDELSVSNGEKFFSRLLYELKKEYKNKPSERLKRRINYFENYDMTEEIETIKDGKEFYQIKKGVIKLNNKDIGYLISRDDFAHLKRNNFTEDFKRFIIDEFMSETHDIRALRGPYKIVSLIQSIARDSTDIKITMLGNSTTINDPILQRLGVDSLKKGEIKAYFDEYGLFMVFHLINKNSYPNFNKRTDKSVAGRLAKAFGETTLDDNDFYDDLTDDIILKGNFAPSKYFMTLKDEISSVRINRTKSGILYILNDYGRTKNNCFTLDINDTDERFKFNPNIKDILEVKLNNNEIRYESKDLYFKLRNILNKK